MRVLLDTVAFILAAESPEKLGRRASAVLEKAGTAAEISSISLSEIAIKQAVGKLRFSPDDVRRAMDDLELRVLPYSADHALQLFDLPLHHADPFDRQIIAQAISERIPVLTSDDKFSLYDGLRVIW